MSYMTFDVESSAVEALAYEDEQELFYITFTGGNTYTYFDVPFDVVLSCVKSDSVGRFVNTYIKGSYDSQEGEFTARPVAVDLEAMKNAVASLEVAEARIRHDLEDVNVDNEDSAALRQVLDDLSGLIALVEGRKTAMAGASE